MHEKSKKITQSSETSGRGYGTTKPSAGRILREDSSTRPPMLWLLSAATGLNAMQASPHRVHVHASALCSHIVPPACRARPPRMHPLVDSAADAHAWLPSWAAAIVPPASAAEDVLAAAQRVSDTESLQRFGLGNAAVEGDIGIRPTFGGVNLFAFYVLYQVAFQVTPNQPQP